MQSEYDRADERGEAEPLIGSFPQRQDPAYKKSRANDDQRDRGPTQLAPQPEPIAFRMQRARVARRSRAENRKDGVEISQTDPTPGRCANQLESVAKDPPPKIC